MLNTRPTQFAINAVKSEVRGNVDEVVTQSAEDLNNMP